MDFQTIYREGIYNVAGSILRHYSLGDAPSLPMLDALLDKDYRHVFLLIMDGLSVKLANTSRFLAHHQRSQIYSVFPPTTTSALTTLYSGLSPIEHGWLGWNVHLPELGHDGVTLLLNTIMDRPEPAAEYHVGKHHLAYTDIIDKIRSQGVRAARISPFEELPATSIGHILEQFLKKTDSPEKTFTIGYWTEPDYSSHVGGAMSPEGIRIVGELAQEMESILPHFHNSLIILLSDHGMTDVEPIYLEDYPDIHSLLRKRISFEARNPSFFVAEDRGSDFSTRFQRAFPDFDLYSHEEVFASCMYGPGVPHPSTRASIGDFVAIARKKRYMVMDRWSDPGFVGAHAGLSAEEMLVPLIVFACP